MPIVFGRAVIYSHYLPLRLLRSAFLAGQEEEALIALRNFLVVSLVNCHTHHIRYDGFERELRVLLAPRTRSSFDSLRF